MWMIVHPYAVQLQGATGDLHFFGTPDFCLIVADDDVSDLGFACSALDTAAN
jgi:hypothetical protein